MGRLGRPAKPHVEGASAGIEKELVRTSVSTTIPQEDLDRAIDDLTNGSKDEVLRKIAFNFLPNVEDTEKLVKDIASKSIVMNFRQEIIAEGGRVTATVGGVDEDLDGHVVQQLCRTIQFHSQIFRLAIETAVERMDGCS